jgi:hypothetical protein
VFVCCVGVCGVLCGCAVCRGEGGSKGDPEFFFKFFFSFTQTYNSFSLPHVSHFEEP